jgi:CheY-like chemotaxis protein
VARFLIIDDEVGILESLEALLEDAGHRVQRAVNGRQALGKLAHEAVDVIILDVMMPIMDGPTLLRALRADPATRTIPVILMTGLHPDEVEALVRDDYEDLLVKPFRAQQLYDAIDRALTTAS